MLWQIAATLQSFIDYFKTTPYEAPDNAALTLDTSNQNTLCESTLKLFDYVSNL